MKFLSTQDGYVSENFIVLIKQTSADEFMVLYLDGSKTLQVSCSRAAMEKFRPGETFEYL